MNATKNGIANCPNCKAVDEAILEGAFLDAFGLLAGNFDDVLDVVLSYVAESADSDENMRKKQQIDKDISSLESKKSRMTDMLIDGTISKEVYEEKWWISPESFINCPRGKHFLRTVSAHRKI
jgi:hypothetical protein